MKANETKPINKFCCRHGFPLSVAQVIGYSFEIKSEYLHFCLYPHAFYAFCPFRINRPFFHSKNNYIIPKKKSHSTDSLNFYLFFQPCSLSFMPADKRIQQRDHGLFLVSDPKKGPMLICIGPRNWLTDYFFPMNLVPTFFPSMIS